MAATKAKFQLQQFGADDRALERRLTRPDPLRHYADLRKTLTQYAGQLARDIDAGRPPAN